MRTGTRGERYLGNLDSITSDGADRRHGPDPVGEKAPNAWGLHDMPGNVSEWVRDRYGSYPGGSVRDPTSPSSGKGRLNRGCSWGSSAGLRQARPPFPQLGLATAEHRGVAPGPLPFHPLRSVTAEALIEERHPSLQYWIIVCVPSRRTSLALKPNLGSIRPSTKACPPSLYCAGVVGDSHRQP